ncbi:MAG: hypothetical protein HKP61_09910 [Dactylosporangium sp.]|nr:hypothetical protein [Dactylosporangium sp.]NNJ61245.1 hypothetical protein [Dactylosporangium sp.]
MDMLLLRIAGWVSLAFGAFHAAFWWIFDWSTTLGPLNDTDLGILLALNVACAYLLFACAAGTLLRTRDLVATPLGRGVSWAIAGFWMVRAVAEFIVFATPSPVLAVVCAGVGMLYVAPLLRTRPDRGTA